MDPSFLLAFPLLLALSTPCSACYCKKQHPQMYYCNSDIVMVVDILGPGNDTVLKRGIRVNVTKILKAPKVIPNIQSIYTPKKWNDCGFELRFSQQSKVMIAGYLRSKRVIFTRCHMVHKWERVDTYQKIGFEGAYRLGCKCRILPCRLCWRGCPEPDVTQCTWKQTNCDYSRWEGNHSLFAMCAPSESGRCEWTQIKRYHNYQTQAPTTLSTNTPLILS